MYSSKDMPTEADYPSSFLCPLQITKQQDLCKKTKAQAKDLKTACSDSHTAANDSQTASSFKNVCDDNGIFGMACWHDIPLKFIDIHNSGKK
ncbi:hypothetical protein CROQUDRAFT_87947 [Cronartium quercuum f. sp. fusiforme G11]|uniref:Uncharacterized protein n=1 Tax=Cronartium quercuum f. sp. fusiforme G11 TaxID=708437 RepID=A0A9P6TG66_9BASI|nr:hypothetical protein CROQUDRAFT_87947 [Cronartium quercuum f. sp. fusiforme G11]